MSPARLFEWSSRIETSDNWQDVSEQWHQVQKNDSRQVSQTSEKPNRKISPSQAIAKSSGPGLASAGVCELVISFRLSQPITGAARKATVVVKSISNRKFWPKMATINNAPRPTAVIRIR